MRSKFRKFVTISGREIYVRWNLSKNVFTIKTDGATYKTYKLPENEFNYNLFNNASEWQNFLGTSRDYFAIK
jgi:hypothetical protein